MWTLRAEAEFIQAPKTVFFTGTFRDQWHEIEPVKREVTLFLKRARKRCVKHGHNFRYLMVPERHKSGAWHYHGLFHVDHFFEKYWLESAWDCGWNWAKWADIQGAQYVTKYVAKDLVEDQNVKAPRIRCSKNPTYGGWVMERDKEAVRLLMSEKEEECLIDLWTKNLQDYLRQEERKERAAANPRNRLLDSLQMATASQQSKKKNRLSRLEN